MRLPGSSPGHLLARIGRHGGTAVLALIAAGVALPAVDRWLLPFVLLFTSSLLLTADIVGRLLVTNELRVSVVTAFLGAPLLIWLARRQRQGGRA